MVQADDQGLVATPLFTVTFTLALLSRAFGLQPAHVCTARLETCLAACMMLFRRLSVQPTWSVI